MLVNDNRYIVYIVILQCAFLLLFGCNILSNYYDTAGSF